MGEDHRLRLDDIDVEDPCCESWDEMQGDERRRHCEVCDKDVVNLSELGRREASALVVDADSLCVRFRRDATGNVVFKNVQLGRQRRGVRELVAASACVLPFALWALLVSPLNDEMSWGAIGLDEQLVMERTVQGGISLLHRSPSRGYEYHDLDAEPQAVVFVDEHGTPQLDMHALPRGQEPSDGVPRLVVPSRD
jgi:hypothetical protein